MAQALSRTLTRIENVLAVLSIVFLFAVVALITFDVFGRRVVGTSLPWIVEVSEYYLLFATFMNAAWVLREQGHIAVDFIDRFLSERGLRRLRVSAYLLTFVVALYLLFFAGRLGLDYFERQTLQGNFILVPQWIMYAPIPVGIMLFLIELGRQFRRFLRGEA